MSNSSETDKGRPPVDTRSRGPAADLLDILAKLPISEEPPENGADLRAENERLKQFVYLQVLDGLRLLIDHKPNVSVAADITALETEVYRTMGKLRQREHDEEYRGMVDIANHLKSELDVDMKDQPVVPIEYAGLKKSLEKMTEDEQAAKYDDAEIEQGDREENMTLRKLLAQVKEKLSEIK